MVGKKYLFLCLANLDRSKTGEIIFKDLLKERGFSVAGLEDNVEADFYVGSAGVRADVYGCRGYSRQYVPQMGDLADCIFIADDLVSKIFDSLDSRNKCKTICLDVPDVYKASEEYDYRMLAKLLKEKLIPYLPERK